MTTRLLLISSKIFFRYRVLFIKIKLSKHEDHDTRTLYVDIKSILRSFSKTLLCFDILSKKYHLFKIRKAWWKQFNSWKHAFQKESNVIITLLTTYLVTHRVRKRISILLNNRQLIDSITIIIFELQKKAKMKQ